MRILNRNIFKLKFYVHLIYLTFFFMISTGFTNCSSVSSNSTAFSSETSPANTSSPGSGGSTTDTTTSTSSTTTSSSSTTTSGSTTSSGSTTTSGTTSSKITVSLQASRITGVAPLAVLFDATGTTNTLSLDSFRQLNYSYNFGDNRGLTWAVSGLPKNTETSGPIAAHVFDNAGTYTISLRVTNPGTGEYKDATITVTVTSADTFYSGSKTICVSTSSNFTGCPSGASQQTSMPSGTGWNGKRVLFHKGESFGDVQILEGNSQVQVGSYGTGATPIVTSVGVGNWRPTNANFASDITVMDLAITNTATQCLGKQVLFYRLDMTSASDGHGFYTGNISYWAKDDPYKYIPTSSFYYANQIFLVENQVTGSFNDGGYNFFGDGSQFALLGNIMGKSKYHTARFTKLRKAIIAHNQLKGINPSGTYHSLKMHSGGLTAFTEAFADDAWYSEQVVVNNNIFGDATADTNQWTVAICPQNSSVAEGITNILVQSNKFIRNSNTVDDLILAGKSLTYRNNTVSGSATLLESVGHDDALPTAWKGPYYSN